MHFSGFPKVCGENIKSDLYQARIMQKIRSIPLVVNTIKFETYIH